MPEPGVGEVLLRVTDAGLSQTQISEFMEGPFIMSQDLHPMTGFEGPIIPCQEYGGVVESVGPDGDSSLIGRQMAVLPLISCGSCRSCQAGRQNVCDTLAYRGVLGADGGFCEYSVVRESELFPVSDATLLNFVEPLLVGVHAARRSDLRSGDRVLVLGAGAVGCALAAVWQDCLGLDVVLHDLLPERANRAERMGLTSIPSEPDTASFDVVVDAAGKDLTHGRDAFVEAIDLVRPGGTVVGIGSYFSPVTLVPTSIVIPERSVISSFAYDHSDVEALTTWIDKLTCDFAAITEYVALENLVEDGYYRSEVDKGGFTRVVTSGRE